MLWAIRAGIWSCFSHAICNWVQNLDKSRQTNYMNKTFITTDFRSMWHHPWSSWRWTNCTTTSISVSCWKQRKHTPLGGISWRMGKICTAHTYRQRSKNNIGSISQSILNTIYRTFNNYLCTQQITYQLKKMGLCHTTSNRISMPERLQTGSAKN